MNPVAPDASADTTSELKQDRDSRPANGMTTKVVKGSLWTLMGQIAPLGVSIFTTPFVIRMLGAESYGVLILVGLIPTYLGFADCGMSIASTKFSSEAFGEGDERKESGIVFSSALIALCTTVPVALLVAVFAGNLAKVFGVSEHLLGEAVLSLRIASITFVVTILCSIVNSPQLSRLRMDLNTLINAGSRIAGLIATPIVIYLGYGVPGAVATLLAAALLNLSAHIFVSNRLVRLVRPAKLERGLLKRILKFGRNLVIATAAAMLVANLEKLVLSGKVSVTALAYYSVAFTFAGMARLFSQSMTQSLVPAFSQLQGPEQKDRLKSLYSTGLRLNLILILPMIAILLVAAEPFFLIWAGPTFAEESIQPFFILLAGLFFNLPAYLPYSVIIASGRTDVFAKLYTMEAVPYFFVVLGLTSAFGIIGAAMAWSLRVFADAFVQFFLARRLVGVDLKAIPLYKFVPALLVIALPGISRFLFGSTSAYTISIAIVSLCGYAIYVWTQILREDEIRWIQQLPSKLILLLRPAR